MLEADSVNSSKSRLDKYWANQEFVFNFNWRSGTHVWYIDAGIENTPEPVYIHCLVLSCLV